MVKMKNIKEIKNYSESHLGMTVISADNDRNTMKTYMIDGINYFTDFEGNIKHEQPFYEMMIKATHTTY